MCKRKQRLLQRERGSERTHEVRVQRSPRAARGSHKDEPRTISICIFLQLHPLLAANELALLCQEL